MSDPDANFRNICLTEAQMMMRGSDLEYFLQRYFYPFLAILGVFGNVLNLTVLLNKNMRSRANTFLAVLAFSDIIFLLLLVPNILANYSLFTFNYYFRWIYFHIRVNLIALANWASAVAIWSVIAVCADRLVGIRNPLYARNHWPCWKMPLVIAAIIGIPGIFHIYQYFEFSCTTRPLCFGTQIYSKCLPVYAEKWFKGANPHPQSYQQTIWSLLLTWVLLMIIFPIILLTVLNMMLLCVLRRRQQSLKMGDDNRTSAETAAFQKTEHRVTLTVTFIVTMFTVTNGPSALIKLLETTISPPLKMYNWSMLASTLVICGKASNFILFCLGSKHFRLRLIRLTQKKMNRKIGHVNTLQLRVRNLFTFLYGRRESRVTETELLGRSKLGMNSSNSRRISNPTSRRVSVPSIHKVNTPPSLSIDRNGDAKPLIEPAAKSVY